MNIYESFITVKLLYEIKYKIYYYFYDTFVSSSKEGFLNL